jgi:hypothetical protein
MLSEVSKPSMKGAADLAVRELTVFGPRVPRCLRDSQQKKTADSSGRIAE